MSFKPPYWYHDNIKFPDDEIQKLKIELSSLKSGNHLHYSSFFLKNMNDQRKNILTYIKK